MKLLERMIVLEMGVIACLLVMTGLSAQAQTVRKELIDDVNRAAGINYALPIEKKIKDTPAPQGKKPFYINHYGCPGPYYLKDSAAYEVPYAVFAKADSLGKLTRLGRDLIFCDGMHTSVLVSLLRKGRPRAVR